MDLIEFMEKNGRVLIAEGYLFEFMRRGKIRLGSLIPEVVLDDPESVRSLHQEFVDAGSDVVQAFTYYATRQKMKDIGREGELEAINKNALQIAKEVARANGKLFAGGLCNTNIYNADDPQTFDTCSAIFEEQCRWAYEAGVDYMIAETFWDYGEASLALKAIKKFGMTAVVSVCPVDRMGTSLYDGVPIEEALKRLEDEGAAVVSLNCQRGPQTMIPLVKRCMAVCRGPVGVNPVCYRTDEETPTMVRLKYPKSEESCYPHDLHIYTSSLKDMQWYGEQCKELGIKYIGLCCGNCPLLTKALALTLGKETKLQKYSMDREINACIGEKKDTGGKVGAFTEFCVGA